jgi:hypothetical protein
MDGISRPRRDEFLFQQKAHGARRWGATPLPPFRAARNAREALQEARRSDRNSDRQGAIFQ